MSCGTPVCETQDPYNVLLKFIKLKYHKDLWSFSFSFFTSSFTSSCPTCISIKQHLIKRCLTWLMCIPKFQLMGWAWNGAHNLLILGGLVFSTKDSSWPSDPTTPLNPHEFSLFPPWVTLPLCVALSPSCTSSLSFFLFSLQNCQPLLLIPISYL